MRQQSDINDRFRNTHF